MKRQLLRGYSVKETNALLQSLRQENEAMHREVEEIRNEAAKEISVLQDKIIALEAKNNPQNEDSEPSDPEQ